MSTTGSSGNTTDSSGVSDSPGSTGCANASTSGVAVGSGSTIAPVSIGASTGSSGKTSVAGGTTSGCAVTATGSSDSTETLPAAGVGSVDSEGLGSGVVPLAAAITLKPGIAAASGSLANGKGRCDPCSNATIARSAMARQSKPALASSEGSTSGSGRAGNSLRPFAPATFRASSSSSSGTLGSWEGKETPLA